MSPSYIFQFQSTSPEALMAVRQEVNDFESSVVVQELDFAMNLALYGLKTDFEYMHLFACYRVSKDVLLECVIKKVLLKMCY